MTTSLPPLPLDEALVLYRVVHLAGRNLAPLTRLAYTRDLSELLAFLAERHAAGVPAADEVQPQDLRAFLAALDERGLKGSYRRRKVAAVRSFFAFLVQHGAIPASPAEHLVPPERERPQPRVLTEREYKKLLEAVRHETRDGAIVELLLQTGLRLSELARLEVGDVELPARIVAPNPRTKEPGTTGAVRVQGKGRKQRTVTLNHKACKAIRAYLAVRPPVDDPRLFITKFGRGIGPRAIENVVAKYLRLAGVAGASVHSLRHTFGTQHARRGTKPAVIRTALGHESLATTSLYVDLAREEMERELQEHAL
ncbi:MAG: tyrosine-type recombinase/integrase [Chloroflexota bacterium]|nr:tyrosine-type recombinase/integrase [Chloroflexota bacterium]